jgi:hypothetical protein
MKAQIIYHPNSEHARTVEEYAHNFSQVSTQTIDLVSLETKEGANIAKIYDIVAYPALLITGDDGHLQKVWQGAALPLMDEVAGYLVA